MMQCRECNGVSMPPRHCAKCGANECMVDSEYVERERLQRQLDTLRRSLERIAKRDCWNPHETALYALIETGLRQSDAESLEKGQSR